MWISVMNGVLTVVALGSYCEACISNVVNEIKYYQYFKVIQVWIIWHLGDTEVYALLFYIVSNRLHFVIMIKKCQKNIYLLILL